MTDVVQADARKPGIRRETLEAARHPSRVDADAVLADEHEPGFGPAWSSGETLLVDPRLPTSWNALEFALRFRGRHLRLRIERSGVTVAPADWHVYQTHDHWEVTTT